MNLFDNTLRDGGNVVGHGFSTELTVSIVKGLLNAGILDIELGNCKGLGAYEQLNATNAPSDQEYFDVLQPYLPKGRIGMFQLARCATEKNIQNAAAAGLNFLRVGANAGDGAGSAEAVRLVKKAGLVCRYSLMKAYVSTPEELATEAKLLQDTGVDKITIMDSAGTMFPENASKYVTYLKRAVTIPVGFHGHSNLGLSQANALAAELGFADRFQFVCASAFELPFPDSSFDTIIMNDFMEHVSDPARTLKEALRLIRPAGAIYINFPPYYHPTGAHLSDVINMPWVHLFFTENMLVKAYKELVKGLPDEKERLELRISRDENGREYFGYINKMTLKKFKGILAQLGIRPAYYREVPLRSWMAPLAKIPGIKEMFVKMGVCIIQKQ